MAKGDEYTPTPKVTEAKPEAPKEVLPEAPPEVPTDVINDENKPVEEVDPSTIPPTD